MLDATTTPDSAFHFDSGYTVQLHWNPDGTLDSRSVNTEPHAEDVDVEDEWEPDSDGVERYLQGQEDREPPAGWEP